MIGPSHRNRNGTTCTTLHDDYKFIVFFAVDGDNFFRVDQIGAMNANEVFPIENAVKGLNSDS